MAWRKQVLRILIISMTCALSYPPLTTRADEPELPKKTAQLKTTPITTGSGAKTEQRLSQESNKPTATIEAPKQYEPEVIQVSTPTITPVGSKAMKTAPLTPTIKLAQAESLRKAYVLLAEGNYDYGGHRIKAMRAIRAGFEVLDASIMKHGTANERAATVKERALVEETTRKVNELPTTRQGQARSDVHVLGARKQLEKLLPELTTYRQSMVLNHTNKALAEIKTALVTR